MRRRLLIAAVVLISLAEFTGLYLPLADWFGNMYGKLLTWILAGFYVYRALRFINNRFPFYRTDL